MSTKAFELLEKDHEKVKAIIEELLDTSRRAKVKRTDMLQELKKELQEHEEIEESYVYPVLEGKKLTHELAMEAYEEHHTVDVLLDELESVEFNDERWKAKLMVLKENLFHHIKEEEENLFVKAEKVLSEEELNTIQDNVAESKQSA